MRRRVFVFAGISSAAALVTLAAGTHPLAVWNVSPSSPIGLYLVGDKAGLKVGERVVIDPPPALRELLVERGYLASGVPLVKRIAAVPGQQVCRFAHAVSVDGAFVGAARARDSAGRTLPTWAGCTVLREGELFVMNPAAPDSFDGRYFGPLRMSDMVGRARPVWTVEHGGTAHTWFADPLASKPHNSPFRGD